MLAGQVQTQVPSALPCDLDHDSDPLLWGVGWQWLLGRGRGAARQEPIAKRWGVEEAESHVHRRSKAQSMLPRSIRLNL